MPTAHERYAWLINFLYPYYKKLKVLITILMPCKQKNSPNFMIILVLALIWYATNIRTLTDSKKVKRVSLRRNICSRYKRVELNYFEAFLFDIG